MYLQACLSCKCFCPPSRPGYALHNARQLIYFASFQLGEDSHLGVVWVTVVQQGVTEVVTHGLVVCYTEVKTFLLAQ